MFQKLNGKYKRLLLTFVTLVSVSYSLAVFFFYCNILKDDYQDKLAYYNKQQVSNVEKSLWRAEFSMNALLSRIDLETSGTFYQFEVRNELKKISDFNLDISCAFMISSKSPSIIGENYALANCLLKSYPELFDGSSQDMRWYYLKCLPPADNMLLCAKTIVEPSWGGVYTICLAIPESAVLPIVTSESENISIFAKNNFSFSILSDSDSILYVESAENVSELTAKPKTVAENTYSTKVRSTPFTLLMQATERPLNHMLLIFFAGISFLCAALLCTACFTLKAFLKRLTSALETLSNQFSLFFDTLDR